MKGLMQRGLHNTCVLSRSRHYSTQAPTTPPTQPPQFPWTIDAPHRDFWKSKENQKKFITWLGRELSYYNMENWYQIHKKDFTSRNAQGLLTLFDGSPVKLLESVFPTHAWDVWKFSRIPRSELPLLDDSRSLTKYVKSVEESLNITKPEDWYSVSQVQLDQLGSASQILKKFGGVEKALSTVYPTIVWDTKKLEEMRKKASQRYLRVVIGELFAKHKIYDEYTHPTLEHAATHEKMVFDIFIPDLSIAFEYYGPHHYHDVPFFGPRKFVLERDKEKRTKCQQAKITLIEIPYWWVKTKESVIATIHKYRPELVQGQPMGEPIPDKDPHLAIKAPKKPADVYNFLLTPQTWSDDMDPTGWWLTEQIQGVWVYWTGKMLVSRRAGKPLARCPTWIYKNLPAGFPLEAMLWLDNSTNFANRKDEEVWQRVQMFILDAPTQTGVTFEDRMVKIKQQTFPPHVRFLDPVKCTGKDYLNQFLSTVIQKGGEGVLLRKPHSLYDEGSLFHVKASKILGQNVDHVEATSPQSKELNEKSHRLVCQMPSGQQLMVSAPHQVITKPFPPNTVITIKYLNRNEFIHSPCFYKLSDVPWNEVVQKNSKLQVRSFNNEESDE